ncbi:unnamed protein product [Phytophthora lilii]|uniref:Unnamed protein product n=1 Tax=Phytophthora lilii TaxID=2077276 RepID=A0A9W6YEW8_9STRA|nr:unnamed protein product [Phytophthora lilii]
MFATPATRLRSPLRVRRARVRPPSTAPDTCGVTSQKQTRVKTASGAAQPEARTDHQRAAPTAATRTPPHRLPPRAMAPKDAADACAGNAVPSQQLQQCATTAKRAAAAAPASPERRNKRQRSSSVARDCEASPKKTKKRLRWSTITVHEFGVGLGGSSVPGKGGPSIGLSDKPEFTWTTKVGQMAECAEGVHRFTPDERVRLLQSAGVSEGMILRFSREANIINCSRRRTLVEDIAERKEAKKQQQQRKVETPRPVVERPCSSAFLDRPRMIPVNYV